MNFDATLFLSALGLAFMIEALPYVLFPEKMRETFKRLSEGDPEVLRRMGLVSLSIGLLIVWLARS